MKAPKLDGIVRELSMYVLTYIVPARRTNAKIKSIGVYFSEDYSDDKYLIITPYKDCIRATEGYMYRRSDGTSFNYVDYDDLRELVDAMLEKVITPYENSFKVTVTRK